MANVVISPNMSLPVPIPGVEPGPQYATDLNASLNIIDGHTHTSGSGVPITTAALNINTDLPMNNNSLNTIYALRFTAHSSPLSGAAPNLGAVYVSGVDLYYNDVNGNIVRITQSGGIAGSPGSISNLTSPASASYVSGSSTFVWQSAANTAANMDAASYTFRNVTAGSHGITVSAPAGLSADYPLVWPASLPGSNAFLTVDNSGNIGDSVAFPLPMSGIANGAVGPAQMATPNMLVSSSSGAFNSTSSPFVPVTNMDLTLTTSGKPVNITFQPDGTSNLGEVGPDGNATMTLQINRNGSPIGSYFFNNPSGRNLIPPGCLNFVDYNAPAGSNRYQLGCSISGGTATVGYVVMIVREL